MEENKKLFETEQYKNIFTIVKHNDNEEQKPISLCIGKYKIKDFDTEKDCKNYIDMPNNWELLVNVTSITTLLTIEKYKENEINNK